MLSGDNRFPVNLCGAPAIHLLYEVSAVPARRRIQKVFGRKEVIRRTLEIYRGQLPEFSSQIMYFVMPHDDIQVRQFRSSDTLRLEIMFIVTVGHCSSCMCSRVALKAFGRRCKRQMVTRYFQHSLEQIL
jgi:hypothetical protein